jgi:hypothetical protein
LAWCCLKKKNSLKLSIRRGKAATKPKEGLFGKNVWMGQQYPRN